MRFDIYMQHTCINTLDNMQPHAYILLIDLFEQNVGINNVILRRVTYIHKPTCRVGSFFVLRSCMLTGLTQSGSYFQGAAKYNVFQTYINSNIYYFQAVYPNK